MPASPSPRSVDRSVGALVLSPVSGSRFRSVGQVGRRSVGRAIVSWSVGRFSVGSFRRRGGRAARVHMHAHTCCAYTRAHARRLPPKHT
eukprot:6795760-Pyramimonas_sp.AAC.1